MYDSFGEYMSHLQKDTVKLSTGEKLERVWLETPRIRLWVGCQHSVIALLVSVMLQYAVPHCQLARAACKAQFVVLAAALKAAVVQLPHV